MGKSSVTDRGLGLALEPASKAEETSKRLCAAQNQTVHLPDPHPIGSPEDRPDPQRLQGATDPLARILDLTAVTLVRQFFELLDEWDRNHNSDGSR